MSEPPKPNVRIRSTARDRKKALEQYQDLRRSGMVSKAIVIVEKIDGSFEVLGQMLQPWRMTALLAVAAQAVAHVEEQRVRKVPEPHEEPEVRGVWNQAKPIAKEVTTAEDGTMVPPNGEGFVSCGVCNHPRWYVLHDDQDRLRRYACACCGNEVKQIPIYHAEGSA